jgi:F0F1-type ATP synthase assembly protein I
MPKFFQHINEIIDSSAVALLSALSRVLFMPGNDFKSRAATFVASICVGLVSGIVISNFESLNSWGDLVVCISALCAKETIDWIAKKMRNPLAFFLELRSQKQSDDKDSDRT